MISAPTREYQTNQSLRLLCRADGASLPEREGLFREVVKLNMGTADDIARNCTHHHRSLAATRYVAGNGLDKAVRTFDCRRERSFWGHARLAIEEQARRYLHPPEVFRRAPPRLQGLALRIVAVVPDLVDELGRSPRPNDIARHLQTDVDDVIEVLAGDGRTYRHETRTRDVQ